MPNLQTHDIHALIPSRMSLQLQEHAQNSQQMTAQIFLSQEERKPLHQFVKQNSLHERPSKHGVHSQSPPPLFLLPLARDSQQNRSYGSFFSRLFSLILYMML
jgi:hypothetical protein